MGSCRLLGWFSVARHVLSVIKERQQWRALRCSYSTVHVGPQVGESRPLAPSPGPMSPYRWPVFSPAIQHPSQGQKRLPYPRPQGRRRAGVSARMGELPPRGPARGTVPDNARAARFQVEPRAAARDQRAKRWWSSEADGLAIAFLCGHEVVRCRYRINSITVPTYPTLAGCGSCLLWSGPHVQVMATAVKAKRTARLIMRRRASLG